MTGVQTCALPIYVDEDFETEQWGADDEAAARRAARWREMQAAALVLAAIEGEDAADPATYGLTPTRPLEGLGAGVAGMRLRVPAAADLASVTAGVLARFRAALADLEALGASIEERPMPQPPEAYMAHAGDILAAEAWHHVGRYVEMDGSVVDPAIRARVLKGKAIDGSRYQELIDLRRVRQVEFMRYMEGADAFLTPTSPITARTISPPWLTSATSASASSRRHSETAFVAHAAGAAPDTVSSAIT